jgi:hypothetical protein
MRTPNSIRPIEILEPFLICDVHRRPRRPRNERVIGGTVTAAAVRGFHGPFGQSRTNDDDCQIEGSLKVGTDADDLETSRCGNRPSDCRPESFQQSLKLEPEA